MQRFLEEDVEVIYDMMHEYIWACSQCFTCWIRCPFVNNPGGLVIIMREVAVRNAFEATKGPSEALRKGSSQGYDNW
ncbi:MAG: hypothetical protein Q9N34_10735 [Aquificota bacterium]|nr:hypothetical protein [Aquificota bacterium]